MNAPLAPNAPLGPIAPLAPRDRARDAKRQTILEIARHGFLEDGYASTSMSAIAARLGGSKGTLYNYFRSKEELFVAMMADICGAETAAMTSLPMEGEIDQVLIGLGRSFVRFMTSEQTIAMHRVVAAESARFPELGHMFYAQGPHRTISVTSAFLAARMAEGRLRRDDPDRAAQHLLALLKSGVHQMRLWGVLDTLTEAEIDAHVAAAVDTFLHGYAAEAAPAAA